MEYLFRINSEIDKLEKRKARKTREGRIYMKNKKLWALLLSLVMVVSLALMGCGSKDDNNSDVDADANVDSELPTITFTHGYYHDESEWAAAAEMRRIYEEFAEAHKDEFNFVIVADETGAEGIYNTALNDLSNGEFYDIADFGGWDITPVASGADAILDLKPYLDSDATFKNGVGVCYDQNLTEDGKIYSVREQIEGVGFWYNEALFVQAGAKLPAEWETWADFEDAVAKLVAADIVPFGLNAGWPTNIFVAAYSQRTADSRAFYQTGKAVTDFNDNTFKATVKFVQEQALQQIGAANFGPGGDSDEQYRTDFFDGNTAMLFNGVWDAGGAVDCGAGIENIKPANFPTDEAGKRASLMSGGCGFVVSNKLDEAQTEAAIEFIKYMTSPEIAERIIKNGIGMAPSTEVDYDALLNEVETDDAKLLVTACQLCQAADYQVLGLGNTFGDVEGELQGKYAGLMDGSKTPEDVVSELNNFLKASE